MRQVARLTFRPVTFYILLLVALLAGCGSRTQLQLLSDARAEAKAYESAQELVKAKIGALLASDVIALTENYPELPAPTATSYAIVADPAILDKPSTKSAESPPEYVAPKCAGPDPLQQLLTNIGSKFVVIGSTVVGACILSAVLSLWVPLLAGFMTIIEEVGILGGVSVLIGSCMIWIGDHPIVVYLTAMILLAVLTIRYRYLWLPVFHRLLDTKPAPVPTTGTSYPSQPLRLKGS